MISSLDSTSGDKNSGFRIPVLVPPEPLVMFKSMLDGSGTYLRTKK
jgi:hypothetical protein